MLCVCISLLLRLYLCAFNDTQPHIVIEVLDNPIARLELYLITLVNSWSWLAVSMSEADHIVDSELCVLFVYVRVVNVECVLRTLRQSRFESRECESINQRSTRTVSCYCCSAITHIISTIPLISFLCGVRYSATCDCARANVCAANERMQTNKRIHN